MSSKAEKRRTHKPHQAVEREKKRAQKRGRYRQERKKKPYHPARYLSRNQQEVVQRLLDGDVTLISNASWAFMEPFLLFLHEVGFLRLIVSAQVAPINHHDSNFTLELLNQVLIVAGDYYAIFDLEELFIILGCEPEICWRVDPPEVRHRYGLPDLVPA